MLLLLFFCLFRLGSDVEQLFPYSALLDQLRKFGKFGTYMAAMFLPMLMAESEDCPDLDALSEDVANGKDMDEDLFKMKDSNVELRKRMGDVFEDMARLGYI